MMELKKKRTIGRKHGGKEEKFFHTQG